MIDESERSLRMLFIPACFQVMSSRYAESSFYAAWQRVAGPRIVENETRRYASRLSRRKSTNRPRMLLEDATAVVFGLAGKPIEEEVCLQGTKEQIALDLVSLVQPEHVAGECRGICW